jgi:hypothetical protein
MNVILWIVAGLLAAAFGMAGVMKTTQPKEKLQANLPWVEASRPTPCDSSGSSSSSVRSG